MFSRVRNSSSIYTLAASGDSMRPAVPQRDFSVPFPGVVSLAFYPITRGEVVLFLLTGLVGEERLLSLEQFRLRLVTDGTEAHLQNGYRVPRITGTQMSRSGGLANSVSMENIGSLIGGSAHITKTGKIALAVQVERSAFGPEEEDMPISVREGKTVRTPRVDTMTIKTQVTAASGGSIVLSSVVRLCSDKVTETFVVVTATIVKP